MSAAPTHRHNRKPANSSQLDGIIAPIRDEYDQMQALLQETLASEVNLVDSVSQYVARARGKGIRPALLLLTGRSLGPIEEPLIRAAVGIELLQTSTLLHDDVIDEATMRRGMPTVNVRWTNSVAILMGDVLFTHALSLFTETSSFDVMASATKQVRVMLEGEVAGHQLRAEPDFSEATYIDVVRRKTGAMLSLACEMGARLSGADDYVISHMAQFGERLGIAFQIADDVLDVTGDPDKAGKPTGQDLREGTITLPLIRALERAPSDEADDIHHRIRNGVKTDEEWEYVKNFILTNGGVDSALDIAHQTTNLAREHLTVLRPSTARQSLQRILSYIVKRNS